MRVEVPRCRPRPTLRAPFRYFGVSVSPPPTTRTPHGKIDGQDGLVGRNKVKQDTKALEASLFGTASKEALEKVLARNSIRSRENLGTMLLRTTYHYFFHTGEAHAVRQQLGHPDLPFFVRGDMPEYLWR